VSVDRTKAAGAGFTPRDVANSVLLTLSGSGQTNPVQFLKLAERGELQPDHPGAQYSIQSIQDLQNVPISGSTSTRPLILGDVASISRASGMAAISHYNTRRVVDIYGSGQDRDPGAVGRDISRILEAHRPNLPRGSFVTLRGQVEPMRTAYAGLLGGLAFAIVLVYLLIVVNFQSWLDPFIIITALPPALAGIIVFLFLTNTTLSVPALLGAIMCMGVGTANSILVVSFAKERLAEHGDAREAAIEAGVTRMRPVLMTALAMIIGMIPMALGLGEGGEQNAPLGRGVIGWLLCATVATLVFVPAVFSLLHSRRRLAPSEQPV
jgi:multidrug efflux pump subunit AcrB